MCRFTTTSECGCQLDDYSPCDAMKIVHRKERANNLIQNFNKEPPTPLTSLKDCAVDIASGRSILPLHNPCPYHNGRDAVTNELAHLEWREQQEQLLPAIEEMQKRSAMRLQRERKKSEDVYRKFANEQDGRGEGERLSGLRARRSSLAVPESLWRPAKTRAVSEARTPQRVANKAPAPAQIANALPIRENRFSHSFSTGDLAATFSRDKRHLISLPTRIAIAEALPMGETRFSLSAQPGTLWAASPPTCGSHARPQHIDAGINSDLWDHGHVQTTHGRIPSPPQRELPPLPKPAWQMQTGSNTEASGFISSDKTRTYQTSLLDSLDNGLVGSSFSSEHRRQAQIAGDILDLLGPRRGRREQLSSVRHPEPEDFQQNMVSRSSTLRDRRQSGTPSSPQSSRFGPISIASDVSDSDEHWDSILGGFCRQEQDCAYALQAQRLQLSYDEDSASARARPQARIHVDTKSWSPEKNS